MELNFFIGSLQLLIAALQLKLEYFSKADNSKESEEKEKFSRLGEAIRLLEKALSETIAFIHQTDNREPNERLAGLWHEASIAIRDIQNGSDLADLTFEKHLYWRNPNFYNSQNKSKLYRISLDNVLAQLRNLRRDYNNLMTK